MAMAYLAMDWRAFAAAPAARVRRRAASAAGTPNRRRLVMRAQLDAGRPRGVDFGADMSAVKAFVESLRS
jgi:hypothetical protein